MATATALKPVSNDAAEEIAIGEPYTVSVTVRGSAAILFHRWSNEAVAEKAFSLLQNQFLHGPISALTEESHANSGSGHTLLDALRKLFRLTD